MAIRIGVMLEHPYCGTENYQIPVASILVLIIHRTTPIFQLQ